MIPFGDEVATLIRRGETTDADGRHHAVYTKHILVGCSWRTKVQINRDDLVHKIGTSVLVRIPAGQMRPSVGDLLIRGLYTQAVTSSIEYDGIVKSICPNGDAFMVAGVTDNTSSASPIPHYKAYG